MENCCNKLCSTKISDVNQEDLFNRFWNLLDYGKQNLLLSNCIELMVKSHQDKCNKWNYYFIDTNNIRTKVCKQFLTKCISISKKRIDIMQRKISSKTSLADLRGSNTHRIIKIDTNFFDIFLKKYPTTISHYTNSQLLYFENPSLTLKILYNDYINFPLSNNIDTNVSYETFRKFFRTNYNNLRFYQRKSDICDKCFEFEQKGINNLTSPEKIEYTDHNNKRMLYKNLKNKLLTSIDKLCIEFDYGQNKPLPLLP